MLIRSVLIAVFLTVVSGADSKCPDPTNLFNSSDCGTDYYCEAPRLPDDKMSFVCSDEHLTMEARDSTDSPWERISAVTCALGNEEIGVVTIATRAEGNTKNIDYAQFRCRGPVCTADPKVAFRSAYCPEGDTCVQAKTNKTQWISCEDKDKYDLEALKKDGRWVEVSDIRCFGNELINAKFTKIAKPDEKLEVFQCRSKRLCDTTRFDLGPGLCRYNENCDGNFMKGKTHEHPYRCQYDEQLQVSFTREVLWHNITKEMQVKCYPNKRPMMIESIPDIPLAFRCVEDAVCNMDTEQIETHQMIDIKTCDLKIDKCALPRPNQTEKLIECDKDHNMEIGQTGGPWKLSGVVDCLNTKLFYHGTDKEIDEKLRCRKHRGEDMKNYFKEECNSTKKCEPPVKLKNNKNYTCPIPYDGLLGGINPKLEWDFHGKLIETGPWIDIESAEYRNNIFVMKEKGGPENPYIPIQFRCVRDATCNVKFEDKFDNKCPANDECLPPTMDSRETRIECKDPNYALEYYTDSSKSWREYINIACKNQDLTPIKRLNHVDGVNITELPAIRCRKFRGCDMSKYYFSKTCTSRMFCDEPKKLSDASTIYDCNTAAGFKLRYDEGHGWKDVDKVECQENKRFVLKKNTGATTGSLEDIPLGLRCQLDKKCNVTHFYKEELCDADSKCEMPTLNSTNFLNCTWPMALRVKYEEQPEWKTADSIECKNDEFEVMLERSQTTDLYPMHIRCEQKKISTCKHPLDGHDDKKRGSKVIFEPAPSWEKSPILKCDYNSNPRQQLVFGNYDLHYINKYALECSKNNEEGNDQWEVTNGEKTHGCLNANCPEFMKMTCVDQIYCSQRTPIASTYNARITNSTAVYLSETREITCPERSEMKFQIHNFTTKTFSDKVLDAEKLKCDSSQGTWNLTVKDKAEDTVIVADNIDSIVWCQYPDCEPGWREALFPEREMERCITWYDTRCVKPNNYTTKSNIRTPWLVCPNGFKTLIRYEETEEWSMDIREERATFGCCLGKIGVIHVLPDEGESEEEYMPASCSYDFDPLPPTSMVKCERKATCQELNPLISSCEGRTKCKAFNFFNIEARHTCMFENGWHMIVNGERMDKNPISHITCEEFNQEWEGSRDQGDKYYFPSNSTVTCEKGVASLPLVLALLLTALAVAFLN